MVWGDIARRYSIQGMVYGCLIAAASVSATPASAGPVVFYTSFSSEIFASDSNGSGLHSIAQTREAGDLGEDRSFGLAVDSLADRMYWTNRGSIFSANLDGTNRQTLQSGIGDTLGITGDFGAGKIYWAQANSIRRANLDGTSMEILLSGLPFAVGIALDLDAGKVYWSDLSAQAILRANLDGTGIEVIRSGTGQNEFLAIDSINDKLYWTDGRLGTVNRSNLNGSAHEVLFSGQSCFVAGIAVDIAEQDLYWTNECGSLHRANFDGSGLTSFNANTPIALALDLPPAAVPEPATLALLGMAILGLGAVRRRTGAERNGL